MARAYSLGLRERVVAAIGDGQSCRQVAGLFRVSIASVVKWAQRARATGSPAPRPMGGRPGVSKLDGARTWLLGRLAEKPDLTLHALLDERGIFDLCASAAILAHDREWCAMDRAKRLVRGHR
jgi:transposase